MERRYEVYIAGRPLVIADRPPQRAAPGMQVIAIGSQKHLDEVIAAMDRSENDAGVWIHPQDDLDLWELFRSKFKFVQAAGGLVQDEKGRLLVIKRLGKWDLPKGKLDEGESVEAAALREVEEECGIDDLRLERPIAISWHTYDRKGKSFLKRTDWFLMHGSSHKKLTPQTDEDIEEVRWMTREEVKAMKADTYPSLLGVIGIWEQGS